MFATTRGGGSVAANIPDVCKTVVGPAVVPIPYPDFGQPAMANPVAMKVFVSGAQALTKASKIQPTNGDEAGASGGGGVASNSIIGTTEYILSSLKVKFEGNPAVRLTDTMTTNKNNTMAMTIAPSQTKVMVMS